MTDNFANTEPAPTVIILVSRESVEGAIALLLALNKSLGGHRFTVAIDVVKVLTSCLIILEKQAHLCCHTESKSFRAT
jgi:hypothetical protein